MRSRFAAALGAAFGLLVLISGGAARAESFDAAEKAEIEAVMRDYLLANPEFLIEVLDALEAKRAVELSAAQGQAIESLGPGLFETPEGTVIGNPAGDVTVVEFFDYNCGYCRHALADMDELVAADPELRFVLKEIPVLGPGSAEAARVSLAMRTVAPESYVEFHRTLLAERGEANEAVALSIAADLDVDEARLREAMASPAVEAALAADNAMADALQITGTPTYVVGGAVLSGAIGVAKLGEAIANTRECGKAVCG